MKKSTYEQKVGLAEMLKGGVIMDVTNSDQAKIAEDSGAVAVMALERIPADIRKDGGIARMSDPKLIKDIQASVTIPVMAKCRIGHFVEAQILESLKVDFIGCIFGSFNLTLLIAASSRATPNTLKQSPLLGVISSLIIESLPVIFDFVFS